MLTKTHLFAFFDRNSCVLVKQLSAESNNNSLISETGPAGEYPSRVLTHSPSGLIQITHMLRKIRCAEVPHSAFLEAHVGASAHADSFHLNQIVNAENKACEA